MLDCPERGRRYRTPERRARALYRVPPAPTPNRTLELFHRRTPLMSGSNEAAGQITFCGFGSEAEADASQQISGRTTQWHADYLSPLPFPDHSFDRVILHRTFDDLASTARSQGNRFDANALLEQISRVLKPGGVIAGCVDNRMALKAWLRRVKARLKNADDSVPRGYFSLRTLATSLASARFLETQSYLLLPDCEDPARLVDCDPEIAKAVFRHELLAARQLWSPSGYWLRRLAVELGIYTRVEESIFFWARKPC